MMDGEGTLNDDMKSYFNKLFGIEDIVEEPVESPIVVEEKEEESKNEEQGEDQLPEVQMLRDVEFVDEMKNTIDLRAEPDLWAIIRRQATQIESR